MENKKEELKGLLKEVITDVVGKDIDKIKADAELQKEHNTKVLEANKELKAQLDLLQNKGVTLRQNTGDHKYIFKGYDVARPARNFSMDCPKEVGDEVSKYFIKALTEANTGAYAVPVEYSNALLGLAELSSVALAKATIYSLGTNSLKIPIKADRATVDHQAFGTANADSAITLGQLTFTIDKRIGDYTSIYNDVLADQNFDVVGQLIEPLVAEAIGQEMDNQMFQGSEFTTTVYSTGLNAVTVSGSVAIAAAITYANLVTTAYYIELERGLQPQWFMPRGALKDVVALTDTYGLPIFNPVPISGSPTGTLLGYPINITPAISNTPATAAMRLCFGDAKKYIIALRQGVVFQVNPYVQMREGITQFVGYARADGNLVHANCFAKIRRVDA
jgi:HK97 family phage major capsid protein